MQNPFAPQPDSNSYHNLKTRMVQNIQSAGINDQIFLIVQKAYEKALEQENIILSRPERNRLFSQVLKIVLDDMSEKLDDNSRSE
jgi:hypothetical protein